MNLFHTQDSPEVKRENSFQDHFPVDDRKIAEHMGIPYNPEIKTINYDEFVPLPFGDTTEF